MNNPNSRRLQIAAICSFTLWIIIFSAGILIDSAPYRNEMKKGGEVITNIVPAALLYTPINAAILCALAGFIGGCASNLALENSELKDLSKDENRFVPSELAKLKTRLQYLQENPFLSMVRGFVVYLTFLAGILIAVDNPFGDGSEAKYLRYAGILSLVAFGMGYDPSRFEQLLESIPQMGMKRKDNDDPSAPADSAPPTAPTGAAVAVAEVHVAPVPTPKPQGVPMEMKPGFEAVEEKRENGIAAPKSTPSPTPASPSSQKARGSRKKLAN